MYKVNYTHSFFKGTALNYFKLSLMDPQANHAWANNYNELISELWTNFGPFDIEANAENELEWLKMCDNQKVANTGKRGLFPIWEYGLERGWTFKMVN